MIEYDDIAAGPAAANHLVEWRGVPRALVAPEQHGEPCTDKDTPVLRVPEVEAKTGRDVERNGS